MDDYNDILCGLTDGNTTPTRPLTDGGEHAQCCGAGLARRAPYGTAETFCTVSPHDPRFTWSSCPTPAG